MNSREWAAGICGRDYAHAIEGKTPFIGTPTYGGMMTTAHANSIQSLSFVFGLMAVEFGYMRPDKESLIQRGRNRIVREFLDSPCSHLLFLDADIEFQPDAVFKLFETNKDCVCAAYPRKQIDWPRVIRGVRAGLEHPESVASSAVVNLTVEDQVDGSVTYDETGCIPVLDAATGFLLISRGLIERLIAAHPETQYVDESDEKQRDMHALFDCFIETGPNGKRRYLSEDYGFSRRVQALGEKVWLRPDVTLHHHGSFKYMGDPDRLVLHNGMTLETK